MVCSVWLCRESAGKVDIVSEASYVSKHYQDISNKFVWFGTIRIIKYLLFPSVPSLPPFFRFVFNWLIFLSLSLSLCLYIDWFRSLNIAFDITDLTLAREELDQQRIALQQMIKVSVCLFWFFASLLFIYFFFILFDWQKFDWVLLCFFLIFFLYHWFIKK